MTNKSIQFKGINRAVPQSKAPDGACQEIINLRFEKGCWRPIPAKTVVGSSVFTYLGVAKTFDAIYLHDIEGGINPGYPNWIGVKDNAVYLINPVTLVATLLIGSLNTDIEINVTFLKRFLLIATGAGLLTYLYSVDGYTKVETLPVPDVELMKDNLFLVDIPTMTRVELPAPLDEKLLIASVQGNYYDVLNSQSSNEGRLYGSLMYVCAYRLFDGSFILPTLPKYFEIANDGVVIRQNATGSGEYQAHFKFSMAGLKASISLDPYTAMADATKDLIESVYVFATKVSPIHKIDENTLKPLFLTFPNIDGTLKVDLFSTFFPVDDDFPKMAQSEGWYKIHEFAFSDVVGKTGRLTANIDTKGYYQDFATRETMITDQFTHHNLVAKALYTYNDRLHTACIKTMYGNPYISWPKFMNYYDMGSATVTGTLTTWLKTGSGKAIVKADVLIPTYRTAVVVTLAHTSLANAEANLASVIATPPANFVTGSAYVRRRTLPTAFVQPVSLANTDTTYGYNETANVESWQLVYRTYTTGAKIIVPSVIGYNDSRAYRMLISYNNGTQDLVIIDKPLKKNEGMNFAYYHSDKFSANELSATDNYKETITQTSYLSIVTTLPAAIQTPFDTNRIQVSEIQNPLIFPAKNSYQVGTGEITAIAAGTEPMSEGTSFGAFPLQVFTTKGIHAMEIGMGDVLYTNILPVNGEVADNPRNVVSVMGGVAYSTAKGLFVVSGRQVVELSEIAEGRPELSMSQKTEIDTLLTDSKYTPGLTTSVISDINFLAYLVGSSVGFDQTNKELIVSNPAKGYSYVYSFINKLWYKVSRSYSLLINNWPKLYGVTATNVYDLSTEATTGMVEVLIISGAQSFEAPDIAKKIERAVLRSNITTTAGTKYAGMYVFASDDVETYEMITGRQRSGTGLKDMLIQRSHGSARFYVFVVNGQMSVDSEIKEIDLTFVNKWNGKLR